MVEYVIASFHHHTLLLPTLTYGTFITLLIVTLHYHPRSQLSHSWVGYLPCALLMVYNSYWPSLIASVDHYSAKRSRLNDYVGPKHGVVATRRPRYTYYHSLLECMPCCCAGAAGAIVGLVVRDTSGLDTIHRYHSSSNTLQWSSICSNASTFVRDVGVSSTWRRHGSSVAIPKHTMFAHWKIW
jgi:hypothetical protein